MMHSEQAMIQHWREGYVCLHPTDTLPGLSFDPDREEAWRLLAGIKGRDERKTCICMLPSLEAAEEFWHDLPGDWHGVLTELWPQSLSVIWRANAKCPKNLVRDDGTVAFRVPLFSETNSWMSDVITAVGKPFPSTSVNQTGKPSATDWQDARLFLEGREKTFIPSSFPVPGEGKYVNIIASGCFLPGSKGRTLRG